MKTNDRIKTLRLRNKQTLEEVAKKVGVTKATVQRWESGLIANMKQDKIIKLAESLKTTPAYILGFEEDADIRKDIQNIKVKEELSPMEKIIVGIFKNLSDEEKGEVILYANNIKNTNNKN